MRAKATQLFKRFFESEKSSGIALIFVTVLSLLITNSSIGESYLSFWHREVGGMKLELFVNDVLMSFFFLLIGLELKREFTEGELSTFKKAILPAISALGGMLVPAAFYLYFNAGTVTQSGYGIPMATDIAFALGVLSLLGNRVPLGVKVFLTALAVIDDLGAIVVIALFYSKGVVWAYLFASLGVFVVLIILNKLKVKYIFVYLLGGAGMWYFMHHSGVHATITGVLLAFVIPTGETPESSPSDKLQAFLHLPVAYFVLPVFAMANTAIVIHHGWDSNLTQTYSLGILAGLVLGKPIGITLFTWIAVKLKLSELPDQARWVDMMGVACLGGIGFTMSIFVTLLAFNDISIINNAKFMILLSSTTAAMLGLVWLNLTLKKQ